MTGRVLFSWTSSENTKQNRVIQGNHAKNKSAKNGKNQESPLARISQTGWAEQRVKVCFWVSKYWKQMERFRKYKTLSSRWTQKPPFPSALCTCLLTLSWRGPPGQGPLTPEHTYAIKRCSLSLNNGIGIELRFIIAPTSTFLRPCSSGSGQANATLPSFTRITPLVTFHASHSLLPSSDTSENSFHSFSVLDYWVT